MAGAAGAEVGTETALQRFIATSLVQKLHDYVPAEQTRGFRMGDRVKRGTKKQVEYGYVVHLYFDNDKPSITVLWMRGAALAPKDAVVTYSDAELPKLDSFRNNYRDAATRGEPPMHATQDMLRDAWNSAAASYNQIKTTAKQQEEEVARVLVPFQWQVEELVRRARAEGWSDFDGHTDNKSKDSHFARIGRSLSHAPKVPAGQAQYYGPHSISKHTDKLVYMRNPREGGKPQYQKDFFDKASEVIRIFAPEWAGDDEDFVVQLKVYDSDNGDYCNEHVDSHDISTQYTVCFGSYKGGELEVKINGEWKPVDLHNKIVCLDARNPHRVKPFTGLRISVIWYKLYDRRMDAVDKITDRIETVADCERLNEIYFDFGYNDKIADVSWSVVRKHMRATVDPATLVGDPDEYYELYKPAKLRHIQKAPFPEQGILDHVGPGDNELIDACGGLLAVSYYLREYVLEAYDEISWALESLKNKSEQKETDTDTDSKDGSDTDSDSKCDRFEDISDCFYDAVQDCIRKTVPPATAMSWDKFQMPAAEQLLDTYVRPEDAEKLVAKYGRTEVIEYMTAELNDEDTNWIQNRLDDYYQESSATDSDSKDGCAQQQQSAPEIVEAVSANLHGRDFYDKDAEAGMQKGMLVRTDDGYLADLGQGPEADQVYTQAEAREIVDAFQIQFAKDALTRLAKDKLRDSDEFETAAQLLDSMLPARQGYVEQCGGRDVALETVQAVFDLFENDSQSEDDGSESNDDGDKSDEDGGESNESGASGHNESAVGPQLKRNTPRRAAAKAAAGAIQARAVIRKKASNRASATRKKRTAKKTNGRKKGGFRDVYGTKKATGIQRSCMQDAAVNGAKELGRTIDQQVLYTEVPPAVDSDVSLDAIQYADCVTKVMQFERENLHQMLHGPVYNLMNLSSGVYFVMTDLKDKDGDKSSHALIYNANATLPGSDYRGVLIDNCGDSPVRYLEDSDRATKESARSTLDSFLNAEARISQVYRLIPVQATHHCDDDASSIGDDRAPKRVKYVSASFQDSRSSDQD